MLHLVPPVLNFLAKSPAVTSDDVASVEGIMVAAAPVPPTNARLFKEKSKRKVLFQEGDKCSVVSVISWPQDAISAL